MLTQSIVFPKSKFSQREAIKWLLDHKYHYIKVDITPNTYRFRQHEPSPGMNYYSKTLDNGVILVIAK